MTRPILWIVGAGGLLGTSLREEYRNSHDIFDHQPIDWGTPRTIAQIDEMGRRFAELSTNRDWAVAWCAGAGIIGTDATTLAAETAYLQRVLDTLPSPERGVVFLASSSGGIYGGVDVLPISESVPGTPISDYGRNKLVQERLIEEWATTNCGRAVIGRISNLYGPGQSLTKQQGLISTVILATLTRQPVPIYVSIDTIRDYLFVADCSRMTREMIARGSRLPAGEVVIKVLASSRSISIAGILSETGRVLGRRPTVVSVPSARSNLQGSALRFRSAVWPDIDRRSMTPLPTGIWMTAESIRTLLWSGSLGGVVAS